MGQVIRASLPTYNALTDTDPRHYSLFTDSDNVLIKEQSRGTGDTSSSSEVTHSLGYVPFWMVMGRVSAGRYRLNNSQDVNGGEWRVYGDSNKIYLSAGSNTVFRYYIFYDNIT